MRQGNDSHDFQHAGRNGVVRVVACATRLLLCALASGCIDAPDDLGEPLEPTTRSGRVTAGGEPAEAVSDAGSASGSCGDADVPPAVGIPGERCVQISMGSLDGFVVSDVAKLLGDARAQSPDYAYLAKDRDAARLRAPLITANDSIPVADLQLNVASIEAVSSDKGLVFQVAIPGSAEPFRYLVTSQDFEDEVDLRQVSLCRQRDQLAADFVFAGTAPLPGIAHAVTIRVEYAGAVVRSSAPVALEVR